MTKETQKQTVATEQIEREEVLAELYLLVKDIFVGKTEKDEEGISVRFLNGQTFRVLVTES